MNAKDKKQDEVVTPEPPQVMDPSKPPVSKKRPDAPKGNKGKGGRRNPKPKLRKM